MCCPVLTDRRNQIQLFHFSLCSPLVLISHSPLNFPSCNKTFEWQWHSPNTSDRHSAPALLLCLSHPLSFPHVLLSEIDRKENKMTGFHITAVIPRDYTGKWLFPHTKGSITARWPLVIVFLNLRVRHPRIGTSVCVLAGVFVCVYVWLSDVIVSVPELLMQWGGIHPVIHPQVFFLILFLLSCLQWLRGLLFLVVRLPALKKKVPEAVLIIFSFVHWNIGAII